MDLKIKPDSRGGYPLMTAWAGRFAVLATPVYRGEGCDGFRHRSAIVVAQYSPAGHLGDLRGGRCAVNDWTSNTGMNLLRAKLAPLTEQGRFFQKVIVTGSHRQSLIMVAEGGADVAAVDCVTLALLRRVDPALAASIKILDWTAQSPSLPLITGSATEPETVRVLRKALHDIADDPALAALRKTLLIDRFEELPADAYRKVLDFERYAAGRGYPRLE